MEKQIFWEDPDRPQLLQSVLTVLYTHWTEYLLHLDSGDSDWTQPDALTDLESLNFAHMSLCWFYFSMQLLIPINERC